MNTVTINNKEYKLVYSVRAMMLFEAAADKLFSLDTLSDQYLFLYCCILAGNKDTDLTFDKLLDSLDEDPSIFTVYTDFMKRELSRQAEFKGKGDTKKGEDKGKN
nr:MAG TPA: tail assembly chaperone protein [Caudoviricetes sp.]